MTAQAPSPTNNRDYAWLFVSNVLGVFATGTATVALALLAFALAGDDAGIVLATALSLKMAVNILVPLVAAAYATSIPRKSWLIFLHLVRGSILLLLPLVTEVHQIYLLIIAFETAAAAFRTAYLAVVPDMLTDERQYAGAIAKARIAYHVESMLSPLIVAGLLFFIDVRGVFVAAVGFLLLAATLLSRVALPEGTSVAPDLLQRMALKYRMLFASPVFRGAIAVYAAATVIVAMVAVNTVVLVRGVFDLDDRSAAIALAVFGAGSIVGSLMSPKLIVAHGERTVMVRSGAAMAMLLMAGAFLKNYASMLILWVALGMASTLCQLPMETILRRMTEGGDRQILYAAHYCLSSALHLVGYLAAGWIGAEAGMVPAFASLGVLSFAIIAMASAAWPPRGARG